MIRLPQSTLLTYLLLVSGPKPAPPTTMFRAASLCFSHMHSGLTGTPYRWDRCSLCVCEKNAVLATALRSRQFQLNTPNRNSNLALLWTNRTDSGSCSSHGMRQRAGAPPSSDRTATAQAHELFEFLEIDAAAAISVSNLKHLRDGLVVGTGLDGADGRAQLVKADVATLV